MFCFFALLFILCFCSVSFCLYCFEKTGKKKPNKYQFFSPLFLLSFFNCVKMLAVTQRRKKKNFFFFRTDLKLWNFLNNYRSKSKASETDQKKMRCCLFYASSFFLHSLLLRLFLLLSLLCLFFKKYKKKKANVRQTVSIKPHRQQSNPREEKQKKKTGNKDCQGKNEDEGKEQWSWGMRILRLYEIFELNNVQMFFFSFDLNHRQLLVLYS